MERIVLSEKIDRGADVNSLQEWFNQSLKNAGVEVLAGKTNDRWIYVETDDPSLFLSMLNLQVYYPLEPVEKPVLRTCWVEKIQDNIVTCSHPSTDGSTQFSKFTIDEWVRYLGCRKDNMKCLDILRNTGVEVDYPINITLDKPSILYRKMLEKLAVLGLDTVFVRGLTPLELDNLLDKEGLGKLTADYLHLTLTTHVLFVKLGVKPSKIIEKLSKKASESRLSLAYTICEWEKLESILFFLETCI